MICEKIYMIISEGAKRSWNKLKTVMHIDLCKYRQNYWRKQAFCLRFSDINI